MTRNEFWLVAFIAAVVSATLLTVLFNGSALRDGNEFHQNVIQRLENIEHMKTPATAKRWTSDDGLAQIKCLEQYPYGSVERKECLNRITAKFLEPKKE